MEFLKGALSALPSVASSPLAFTAYLIVIAAWLVIALKVNRNRQVLRHLKDLPAKDRLEALKAEMGTVPLKQGLSPEQYLRSRIHLYYFLGFAIICLLIVIIVSVSIAYRQPTEGTVDVVVSSYPEEDEPVERVERPPQFDVSSRPQKVPVAVDALAPQTSGPKRDELTYTYEKVGDKIEIKPQMEYLSLLAKGGPIHPTRLKWRFPKLSVKIVNNTSRTLLLSEAVIDIKTSRLNNEPVVTISAPEENSMGDFFIFNQGWGPMIEPVIKFAVTPVNQCSSRAEDFINVIPIPTFSDRAQLTIVRYVPATLSSARQVCMSGEITYTTENREKRTVKFEAPVTLQFDMVLYKLRRPSYKYNLFLDVTRQGPYTRRIPISHEIKSGDTDVFLIEIGADKSADFELAFSFSTVGGKTLPGGKALLQVFVPKSDHIFIAKKGDRSYDELPTP